MTLEANKSVEPTIYGFGRTLLKNKSIRRYPANPASIEKIQVAARPEDGEEQLELTFRGSQGNRRLAVLAENLDSSKPRPREMRAQILRKGRRRRRSLRRRRAYGNPRKLRGAGKSDMVRACFGPGRDGKSQNEQIVFRLDNPLETSPAKPRPKS